VGMYGVDERVKGGTRQGIFGYKDETEGWGRTRRMELLYGNKRRRDGGGDEDGGDDEIEE
jgi:hypothetical protein